MGITLLFGMVFVGAILVSVTGMVLIDTMEESATDDHTVQAISELRSDFVDLGEGVDAVEVHGDPEVGTDGELTLTVYNDQGEVLGSVSQEMGTLRYEGGATYHTYQAGGIFTESDSGTVLQYDPGLSHTHSVHDGDDLYELSLPPLAVEAADEATGNDLHAHYDQAAARENREALEAELFADLDQGEQVERFEITISDNTYADAWERFLEAELEGDSTVDRPADETVVAEAPVGLIERYEDEGPEDYWRPDELPLGGALTTSADEIDLQNSVIDSYDSSEKPYDDHADEERRDGTIAASGDVTMGGQAHVYGDVISNETVELSGNAEVDGSIVENQRIVEPTSMAGVTDDWIERAADVHESGHLDNERTDVTDDAELDLEGAGTLDSGVYYLDSVDVGSGETLRLDVSDGDIVVAVEDSVGIDDGTVEVVGGGDGDHEVRWFVRNDFSVDGGDVGVEGDRSSKNWVFVGDQDGTSTITLDNQASFTGVMYSPSNDITVERGQGGQHDTNARGALVGSIEAAGPQTEISFDQALEEESSFSELLSADLDGGVVSIGDENVKSYDAKVTLVDAEFAAVVEQSTWQNGIYYEWYEYWQAPISTTLLWETDDETIERQPWPETDLDEATGGTAGWANDVNHPVVEYPKTFEMTDIDPSASFTAEVAAKQDFCEPTDSYAGTSRTPDSGKYSGETLYEMGCADENAEPDVTINAFDYLSDDHDPEEDGERVRALEDGDQVPDIEPSAAQREMGDMLGDKVVYNDEDEEYQLDLDEGEFALVFELANDPETPTWEEGIDSGADAPDYNDVVMLYEITDIEHEQVDIEMDEHAEAFEVEAQTDNQFAINIDGGVIEVDSD